MDRDDVLEATITDSFINSASLEFIPKDDLKNRGFEKYLELFKN